MYGEAIINRLPLQSKIRDPSNPMNKIINNTIGEWLDRYDVQGWLHQFFIQDATGSYLDLHGRQYGLKRKPNEDDDSFKQRIIYEMLGHLTTDYLTDVYGVELYTNPADTTFVEGTTLVSDNPYLNSNESVDGFIGKTDSTTEGILNRKFVLDEAITWL